MAHEVKQEAFEGPLDLLLHLITRQRVDIYDVSLSEITSEYLAEVARRSHLDLEAHTGFLVVAASLLELKASRLLPSLRSDEPDGGPLEERDFLLARLVEVATFREAGTWISAALNVGEAYLPRHAGLEPHLLELAPDLLGRTTVQDVAFVAARTLSPKPPMPLDTTHVLPLRESIKDAITEVATALCRQARLSFRQLCGRHVDRAEVVVRFLALLELFKAGAVDLVQGGRFGEIQAVWTKGVRAEQVLADIEDDLASATKGGTG